MNMNNAFPCLFSFYVSLLVFFAMYCVVLFFLVSYHLRQMEGHAALIGSHFQFLPHHITTGVVRQL